MRRWSVVVGAVLVAVLNAAVLACPMCKDSIPGATGSNGDPSQMSGGALPGGFNTSVYLMLVGFMGTLGLISWTLVKGVRNTPNVPPGFPVIRPTPPASQPKDDVGDK